MSDLIRRQEAINELVRWGKVPGYSRGERNIIACAIAMLDSLPSAQPEIIYCKECKYGEQDEVGRWYCRNFGCQVGNDDGSGFCADAERRADE